ncbi:Mitochondrial import inner membrane translocase subunit tim16 [Babesia bigemina]|uniref:Mitochondrial import inner membrane translocase subunit tim16 n=1 Tax=Babesia bigemina TaxID=5866 RepID=A0A061D3X3_BABBI|nr:Mitochondrial import inner membrane translocase subunit tim16 [Babesia bigemina]CDR93679.1 Mitochondrial import inner membrane translocase subunit tim16 [Babesia bigemina]|eukprot:XP_012765865.1 Mitochondrial import inner membrane translocase subunit tim16 [Babesia bigemina]
MIPIRPLARVLTQVLWIAGGSVVKATLRAYRESVANGAVAGTSILRRQMSPDEAAKILGLPSTAHLPLAEIEKAHQRLRNINMASSTFQGSPYLVERIDAAQHVLKEHLGKP